MDFNGLLEKGRLDFVTNLVRGAINQVTITSGLCSKWSINKVTSNNIVKGSGLLNIFFSLTGEAGLGESSIGSVLLGGEADGLVLERDDPGRQGPGQARLKGHP